MYSIKDEYKYPEITCETTRNYIENRLIVQITWYDGKSAYNQKMYKRLIAATTIISALIPVVTMLVDMDFSIIFKIIIVVLSSSVTVLTGISSVFNYKELWTQYRHNCEMLKSILHRYYTKVGEFSSGTEQERFERLVESCERYFTVEFDKWHSLSATSGNQNP